MGEEAIAGRTDTITKMRGLGACVVAKLDPMTAGRVRHAIAIDMQLSGQSCSLGHKRTSTGRLRKPKQGKTAVPGAVAANPGGALPGL